MTTYDSAADTLCHIQRVNELLMESIRELIARAIVHDQSKLQSPEKEAFDVYTPRLRGLTYGSDEYRECLREMGPAIKHHQHNNSHHPEYYENGIDGMNLFDVIEMLMDWKAASERHDNGCIHKSIEINTARFTMSPQLVAIFRNTVKHMGWD